MHNIVINMCKLLYCVIMIVPTTKVTFNNSDLAIELRIECYKTYSKHDNSNGDEAYDDDDNFVGIEEI